MLWFRGLLLAEHALLLGGFARYFAGALAFAAFSVFQKPVGRSRRRADPTPGGRGVHRNRRWAPLADPRDG